MLDIRLYMVQRISALLMAPSVIVHLIVMIYAVQGGLSAEEILGRTAGSLGWFLFYASFVLTAAVHSAIGLRVIMYEWLGIRGYTLSALSLGVCLMLILTGLQAVFAVTRLAT